MIHGAWVRIPHLLIFLLFLYSWLFAFLYFNSWTMFMILLHLHVLYAWYFCTKILNKISLNLFLHSVVYNISVALYRTLCSLYNRRRPENMINILCPDDLKFYVGKMKPKLWNPLTGWFQTRGCFLFLHTRHVYNSACATRLLAHKVTKYYHI